MMTTCTRCKHTYDDALVERCLLCGTPPMILVHSRREFGMRVAQEKVREFHEKYGYANPDKPEVGPKELADMRMKLIGEELNEYDEACADGDLVGIADAIADLAYVVIGTAVSHGIDLQPLFDEVHRSNMTKDPAADNPHKPVKGPRFEQPRLAALLLIQASGLNG